MNHTPPNRTPPNRILLNILPPDGYQFRDPDGSGFKSTGWTALIQLVSDYRKRKGLPTEGVAAEVFAQACARNPQICDTQVRQGQRVFLQQDSLKSRTIKWLDALRKQPQPVPQVGAEEARRRAGLCLRCPNNRSVSGGCGSCVAAMNALRDRAFSVQRPKFLPDLHSCAVLGLDLKAATWLEEELAVSNPELPDYCWKKKTV